MTIDHREFDELLEAARNGDEQALANLFDGYREKLERIVKLRLDRRLQGRVDPADVVQETYLTIRKKFPAYIVKGLRLGIPQSAAQPVP